MKRCKFISLVIILVFACVGLVGCGDCDHNYGNWITKKTATCTTDGEKERTCSECGNIDTAKIESPGHNYVNGVCTECGNHE